MSSFLNTASASLFFTKNDPQDPRCGELFQSLQYPQFKDQNFILWGYPDDEGIRLNGGRPGAASAPDSVRQFFYKMTPPLFSKTKISGADWGNLSTEVPLAERHERGRSIAQKAFLSGAFVFSLGGGHDYGYADGAGFIEAHQNSAKKPLIINFDAHLDVRPLDRGLTSGTPFYRLLTNYPSQFKMVEFGIQSQCNSRFHYDWALNQNVHMIEFAATETMKKALAQMCHEHRDSPTWISFDIDSFSNAFAPGCSQSFARGFHPDFIFECFRLIFETLSVKGLSIYEVSPPLDVDHHTSKLAALLMHSVLELQQKRLSV
jgi:formiminoglutamase